MNKLIFNTVRALSICAVLGVSSLSAQGNHKIVVNVPFDFTVVDKHFTAGDYTLTSETLQSPILIRGEQGGNRSFVLALPAQSNKVQENAKLVFHQYGNQYFLSKIWYPGSDQGRELKASKLEQQVARDMSKPEETTLIVTGPKQRQRTR
jgi:hypothetical protein